MTFMLRLALIFMGLISSYIGSLSLEKTSGVDFAVGGVALLVAVLCFFFLAKGLWRFLGCFSTLFLMALFVGILFFFLSGNATKLLDKFAGGYKASAPPVMAQQTPAQAVPMPQQPPTDLYAQMMPQQQPMPPAAPQQPAAPMGPPVLTGQAESIVSGDVFRMNGQTIRLFGLATPLINQTCTDSQGRTYDCGYIAARKLKEFIGSDQISCKFISVNPAGEIIAPCSVGTFDIGAAMVEEGWAIALPTITPVYVPYEAKAKENKSGLWAGKFQTPWEWMAEQKRIQEGKAKVKVPSVSVPKPKINPKSMFDAF